MIRQWYYDGVAVPGATGKTVTVGAGQLDRTLWECRTQVDYGADSVAALVGIGGGGAFSHAFSSAFDGGIPSGGEFDSAFNSAFDVAA